MTTFEKPSTWLSDSHPGSLSTVAHREEIRATLPSAEGASATGEENELLLRYAEGDQDPYTRLTALSRLRIVSPTESRLVERLLRLIPSLSSQWLLEAAFEALAVAARSGHHQTVQQFLLDSASTSTVPNIRFGALKALADSSKTEPSRPFQPWQIENVTLLRRLVLSEPENFVREQAIWHIAFMSQQPSSGRFPDAMIELAEQWLLHTDLHLTSPELWSAREKRKIPGYFGTARLLAASGPPIATQRPGHVVQTDPTPASSMRETQDPIELTAKSIKKQILQSNATMAVGAALVGVGLVYASGVAWFGLTLLVIGAVWRYLLVPARKWWKQG